MTSSALALPQAAWRPTWITDRAPLFVVIGVLMVLWYLAAFLMNAPLVRDAFERNEVKYTFSDVIAGTMDGNRPIVPAPHLSLIHISDAPWRPRR